VVSGFLIAVLVHKRDTIPLIPFLLTRDANYIPGHKRGALITLYPSSPDYGRRGKEK